MPPEDQDGFTPVMRAIRGGCEVTALHWLNEKSDWYEGKDKEGNTPLHMAIQKKHTRLIHQMLGLLEANKFSAILFLKLQCATNDAGETPAYLIGELEYVPSYLEKQILRNPELRGIRSSWSIPKSQLQNYMSSVNVIAALLTTITFTAAFTVPGGLDQENGTPLLIGSLAFQVFMVSDVIAMCLSMMVLFCLLWIDDSVMIQDFAVTLLLASFVATLLTFMAGLYTIIFPVKPSIAIATLVPCSLLVHRFILTKVILPIKNAIKHPIYTDIDIFQIFESVNNLIFH